MRIELPYGKGKQSFVIPDKHNVKVLKPNSVTGEKKEEALLEYAIKNPIGTARLKDIVSKGEKIAIITSDITRPMPTKKVIPHVICELEQADVRLEDVTIIFALGAHRGHSKEEMKQLVGEDVYNKISCIDSNPNDSVHLGVSESGTPIDIFSVAANADRRICLGNVEYHYFAGYSGGAKAIMPGVSTMEAIQANHSMMVQERAVTGVIEGNPVRQDIEDAARFVHIDFILNVVLDENKTIAKAVAGHYIEAHRQACDYLDQIYKVKIEKRADVVVVSPGGYPKDINLYQAQKVLDNAKHAVKKGGTIILAASSDEGLCNQTFERWMTQSESPEYMVSEIARNFELGGHKAAAIAMVLKNSRILLVSSLDAEFVRSIFLEPFGCVQSALDSLGGAKEMDIIVMPWGGSTLPDLH